MQLLPPPAPVEWESLDNLKMVLYSLSRPHLYSTAVVSRFSVESLITLPEQRSLLQMVRLALHDSALDIGILCRDEAEDYGWVSLCTITPSNIKMVEVCFAPV